MKTKETSIKKHILKYGLIYGGLWLLKYAIFYTIYNSPAPNNLSSITIELLLYIGGITYGIYVFKKINNGYLKFGNAIKIGVGMSIIAFIIAIIWILIYRNIIAPNLISDINNQREKMILNNPELSPEEIKKAAPIIKNKFLSIDDLGPFIIHLLCNFIVSLIAGAIMHKKKKM